ncbi:hypothetical protein RJT34_11990 [Clitoria ternatea]|uniref:Uncharacterized protein n=1 Tax=Clitoria ternatea TaxID=43366 RepID=A0AAN9PKI8_CLITE
MAEDGTVTLNNTTVVTDPKQNPYSFKPGVSQAFRGGAILLVSNPHQAKITEKARAITVSEPSRVRVIHFVELQDSDPRTEIQIQDQDLAQRAVLKRKESVSQGLLEPDHPKASSIVDIVDNLQPDEVVDLEEIERLQGLTVLCDSVPDKSNGNGNQGLSLLKPEFASDFDFDGYGKSKARILEASFRMSFVEFLVESKIVPVYAYGDLENKITGIQHDSRIVSSGGLSVQLCPMNVIFQREGHGHCLIASPGLVIDS